MVRTETVYDECGSYEAQHDEYKTECYCEHCGHHLGDKDFTYRNRMRNTFDESIMFCPKCGKPLYHMFGEKVSVIEQIISDIENELAVSTSTTYRCKDGETIGTDVGYVWEWFERYKEVMRRRYGS